MTDHIYDQVAERNGKKQSLPENKLNKLPGGLRALRMLFKEVIQQCPPEDATKLWHGYLEGGTIILSMGQNSCDPFGNKTAFRFVLANQPRKWFQLKPEEVEPEKFLMPPVADVQ
jgi:hypothetical protein